MSQAADEVEAKYYKEKAIFGHYDDDFDSEAVDLVEARSLKEKADAAKDVEDWDDDDELLFDGDD